MRQAAAADMSGLGLGEYDPFLSGGVRNQVYRPVPIRISDVTEGPVRAGSSNIHNTMYRQHVPFGPSRIDPANPTIRKTVAEYEERLIERPQNISRVEIAAQLVKEKFPYTLKVEDPTVLARARTPLDIQLGRGPELGRLAEEAGGLSCLGMSCMVSYLASEKGKELSTTVGRVSGGGRHAFNVFTVEGEQFAVDVAAEQTKRVPLQDWMKKTQFTPEYAEPWNPKIVVKEVPPIDQDQSAFYRDQLNSMYKGALQTGNWEVYNTYYNRWKDLIR